MPEDPEGAIFAYNHADWYVADVLARAACFNGMGSGVLGGITLIPSASSSICSPPRQAPQAVPEAYLAAFQSGGPLRTRRGGVWALAAIARLESNYGRGMSRGAAAAGPLGISSPTGAVRGGRRRRRQGAAQSPGDSAAPWRG